MESDGLIPLMGFEQVYPAEGHNIPNVVAEYGRSNLCCPRGDCKLMIPTQHDFCERPWPQLHGQLGGSPEDAMASRTAA